MTLAERINEVVKAWDPYGYRDSDCSVEYFEDALQNCPEVIIDGLLEQIDCMQEVIDKLYPEKEKCNGEFINTRRHYMYMG